MSDVRSFVARLAMAGKDYKDIKSVTDAAYGEKTLSRSQIYLIMKQVKDGKDMTDQRGRHTPKRSRTAALINDVAAAVKEDGRITLRTLASAHGVSIDTIHKILHEDLGLSKKSARWVPKLLNQEQKAERVRVCRQFVSKVHHHSKSFLNTIVTMDETMISLHTPETKKQSKMWVKKGAPGPIN